jgi:6-phosphogluconolactonase
LPAVDRRYDLALLGMGNDGHFSSLFPGTPRLAELLSLDNRERVVAVPPPTTASPAIDRISLTLAEIRRSDRVVLVLQGAAKLEVLKRAWQSADAMQTPVVALGDVEVLWCP